MGSNVYKAVANVNTKRAAPVKKAALLILNILYICANLEYLMNNLVSKDEELTFRMSTPILMVSAFN